MTLAVASPESIGALPPGWTVHALGELLMGRPSYGINAPALPLSDQLPTYLRITDITDEGRLTDERVSVRADGADRYQLQPGDLVFARTGASVGKSYLYTGSEGALVYAGFLIRVRPDVTKVVPRYLAAYVTTGGYWSWIRQNSMRSGQPGVNGNEFASLPVVLPPLPEQRAIAAALSDVDALIAALDQLIAKKRDLKTATMQQLLTGQRRLPGFTGAWNTEPLGSIGSWFSGGTPAMANPTYWGGSIPWVSPKDMKVARIFDAQDHVTERALGNGTRLLPPGALMVVVRGMILAHSLPVARAERPVAFNQDIKGLVVHERISSDFILWWLISHEARLLGMTTESTHGTKRMDTETLFAVKVPVPPRKEQDAIAEILTDMDDELRAVEARREKTRLIKQGMMQELLTGRTRLDEAAP